MNLSNHDLKQINENTLDSLNPEQIKNLCKIVIMDLKESRERLNQNSHNSSKPSSTNAPWDESKSTDEEDSDDDEDDEEIIESPAPDDYVDNSTSEDETSNVNKSELAPALPKDKNISNNKDKDKNLKPGKQLGAQGFGRTQKLESHAIEKHAPECCAVCRATLVLKESDKAWTGWLSVDIAERSSSELGISFFNTTHLMMSIVWCAGHGVILGGESPLWA